MTTYLPILTSFISVLIAATALGWNIYRDVFSKARVKAWANRIMIMTVDRPPQGPFLNIEAKNLGPGAVKIEAIIFQDPRRWLHPFNKSGGEILYDWENPFSGKLPIKLEPGDTVKLLLSWSDKNEDCIFNHPFRQLGVRDSFERKHWVPKKQIQYLKSTFQKEFGDSVTR